MSAQMLRVVSIRVDGGTQTRAGLSRAVVQDYAETMARGAKFPPPVVFHDGKTFWLADGFHRVEAMRSLGRDVVPVEVRQGTREDAIEFSVEANVRHGLRRTNADKRAAVLALLGLPEWAAKSDPLVAEKAGVDHKLVSRLRDEVSLRESSPAPAPAAPAPAPPKREGADGKKRPAQMTCGHCGELGHNKRGCPELREPQESAAEAPATGQDPASDKGGLPPLPDVPEPEEEWRDTDAVMPIYDLVDAILEAWPDGESLVFLSHTLRDRASFVDHLEKERANG